MKITKSAHRHGSRLVVLLASVLLMTGCARTPPVAYYQLSAVDSGPAAAGASPIGEATIGLGPVLLPEFLDRPHIVIREGANRLQLAEGHRWAEPLAGNIARVLRENLAARLATERIVHYPWNKGAAVDYQIVVEMIRFESEGYKEAHLAAVWSIQGRKGEILLPQRRSEYNVKATQPDCEGLVQALSQSLALLCLEFAEQVAQKHNLENK
jgi:uncharacterized lipoprotein YmbA